MLKHIIVFIVLFSVNSASAEFDVPDFWVVDTVEVNAVPDIGGINLLVENQCNVNSLFAESPLDLGTVGWDEIINIGMKVWQIVLDNKPVVHVEIPVAHAMPRGLNCWSDLERWRAPSTNSYEVLYKNKFGAEVVKFRFRLQFTHGGSHAGLGRYIANATVMPAQIDVLWGYTFNAKVDIAQAVNLGTKQDPVAGLEMNLHWNVKTWVKESDNSVHFFIDGNGNVNHAQ